MPKKQQINYLAILGYVAQLAPLIAIIDADFSDDVTPDDRKKSTAHAIGATLTTAVQLISQNNPKYSEDLASLNGIIQAAIAKYLTPVVPDASAGGVVMSPETEAKDTAPPPQPEWARAHEVLNAIRDDLSRRAEVLQAEVNSKIEEIDHYRQVMARIDGGPAPIALNKEYAETASASAIRRW